MGRWRRWGKEGTFLGSTGKAGRSIFRTQKPGRNVKEFISAGERTSGLGRKGLHPFGGTHGQTLNVLDLLVEKDVKDGWGNVGFSSGIKPSRGGGGRGQTLVPISGGENGSSDKKNGLLRKKKKREKTRN